MRRTIKITVFAVAAYLIFVFPLFAAQTNIDKLQRSETQLEEEKRLQEKIDKVTTKVSIEQPAAQGELPVAEGEKVLIKNIVVTGVVLLPEEEITAITSKFKNTELSVRDMQKAAGLITDAYRKKGFVTSRAYIPPQKIENATLEISVIEGITGVIDVKGNKYFKASLLKKKIALKRGQAFNYETLRRGLAKINQQPDRNARAVLVPGKDPGTTDVVLEVKDNLPIHVGVDWDNYGSRYIDKDRLRTTIKHNNLLGFDDIATIQYQVAEAENYVLLNGRYVFPVTNDLQLGLFAAKSRLKLGREYEDLNSRGKTTIYSVYAIQNLIGWENFNVSVNTGFDYKDIFNFELAEESSRDRLRVAKAGIDFDMTDSLGRTLVSEEIDFGIPNIMDGSKDKDPSASRAGSGGQYTKNILNLIRLNKMPYSSMLLWKNQIQTSNNTLPAAEQFQIGGIANVRGYPAAEAVGDKGYSSTVEWSLPPYFVPKDIKVPLSKAKFYDAFRFVTFYDWANTRRHTPQPGEGKNKTLSSAGAGIRFNLPENFSCRFELAWPLTSTTPSDKDHVHPWFEVAKTF